MRRRINFRVSCAAGNDKSVICALANPQSPVDRSIGCLLAGRFTRGFLADRQRVYLNQHAVRGELGEPGSGYARSCFLPSFLRQAQDNRKYSVRPALRRAQALRQAQDYRKYSDRPTLRRAQGERKYGLRPFGRLRTIGYEGAGLPFDGLRANGDEHGSRVTWIEGQVLLSRVDRGSGLAFMQRSWHCRTLVGI